MALGAPRGHGDAKCGDGSRLRKEGKMQATEKVLTMRLVTTNGTHYNSRPHCAHLHCGLLAHTWCAGECLYDLYLVTCTLLYCRGN